MMNTDNTVLKSDTKMAKHIVHTSIYMKHPE